MCGGLLVLGLASRLASIPLMVTMVVAILTAKLDEIHGLPDLFGEVEWTYLVLLFVIAVFGPGKASLDALVQSRLPGTSPWRLSTGCRRVDVTPPLAFATSLRAQLGSVAPTPTATPSVSPDTAVAVWPESLAVTACTGAPTIASATRRQGPPTLTQPPSVPPTSRASAAPCSPRAFATPAPCLRGRDARELNVDELRAHTDVAAPGGVPSNDRVGHAQAGEQLSALHRPVLARDVRRQPEAQAGADRQAAAQRRSSRRRPRSV